MRITCVQGDITTETTDAIVNAANSSLLGGGGVDGAIHRAAGPGLLSACRELRATSLPDGLPVGDAVATPGFDLPARWVIHTVGPNYGAGQRDRSLLESCYRRSLEVADELGATSVAFPLISAGIYAWPREDAIRASIDTIRSTNSAVDEVRLVAFGSDAYEAISGALSGGLQHPE